MRSGTDNSIATFEDGEILIVEDTFTYGNTTVSAGETIATLVSHRCNSDWIYRIYRSRCILYKGTFVDVADTDILLDPYTNSPSYRVGLTILEEIVSAKDDKSLYDNAKDSQILLHQVLID